MKDYERLIDIFAEQSGEGDAVSIDYRVFFDKKKRPVVAVMSHNIIFMFNKKGKLTRLINYQLDSQNK